MLDLSAILLCNYRCVQSSMGLRHGAASTIHTPYHNLNVPHVTCHLRQFGNLCMVDMLNSLSTSSIQHRTRCDIRLYIGNPESIRENQIKPRSRCFISSQSRRRKKKKRNVHGIPANLTFFFFFFLFLFLRTAGYRRSSILKASVMPSSIIGNSPMCLDFVTCGELKHGVATYLRAWCQHSDCMYVVSFTSK